MIGVVAFGGSGSAAPNASTVQVSTPAQLVTAVIGASAGETIELAPGNYPVTTALDVSVANLTVEGPTTAPGAIISGGVMKNASTIDPGQLDIFAIGSGDSLNVHDVVLTQAIQPSNGAVVVTSGGAATVSYSLLSGNTAPAVNVMSGGQATVTNSTIYNSIFGFDGVALEGTATFNEDTIAGNAGNGIDNSPTSSASVTNTILANNTLGNCNTTTGLTGSHDGDTGTTCGATITTGGFSNVSAGLGPLVNNGGPSGTLALQAGSPAIDHGTGAGAAADDQRHYLRDANPDIGAYEFGAKPLGATLTVKKIVVGGTALPSDFTMIVTDTTTSTVLSSAPGSATGTQVSVPAGDNYTVTESGGPAGYVGSDSAGCSGTAVGNATPTCTITNTDASTLTVKKVVVGPGQPSDFTMKVTDTTTSTVLASSPGSASGTSVAVPVGDNYTVTESGPTVANYQASPSADCTGTATQGVNPTCTITNTAHSATLTVKKVVVGPGQPSDFTLTVTDTTTNTVVDSSPGSAAGHQVVVPSGDNYTVTESGANVSDYTESNSAACTGTAAANVNPTCTITNTAKPSTLTVKKIVVGPGQPSDFTLTVTDTTMSKVLSSAPGSAAGRQVSVPAGDNYSLSESGSTLSNYTASASAGCAGTATFGGTFSCTLTNTAKPATLTVTKVVVGGTAAPSDFTLTVTDTTTNATLDSSPGSASGHQVTVPAGHGYKVTESGAQVANYNESNSAGCSGTAAPKGTPTCVITNTAKNAGGGGGGAKKAKLKVIVHVSGGKAKPSAFVVHVHGPSAKPKTFHGSKSGTSVTMKAGSYSVKASGPKGYKAHASSGCHGKLGAGKSAKCTITEKH